MDSSKINSHKIVHIVLGIGMIVSSLPLSGAGLLLLIASKGLLTLTALAMFASTVAMWIAGLRLIDRSDSPLHNGLKTLLAIISVLLALPFIYFVFIFSLLSTLPIIGPIIALGLLSPIPVLIYTIPTMIILHLFKKEKMATQITLPSEEATPVTEHDEIHSTTPAQSTTPNFVSADGTVTPQEQRTPVKNQSRLIVTLLFMPIILLLVNMFIIPILVNTISLFQPYSEDIMSVSGTVSFFVGFSCLAIGLVMRHEAKKSS